MIDKKKLRKICKEKRKSLTKEERESFSKEICRKLIPYIEGKRIFSYCPFSDEADVSMINRYFKAALPVIKTDHIMEAYIPEENLLIENRYGIKEPDPLHSLFMQKEDIDVILIPCLAFNKDKYRLGYGGGYYDCYLKESQALKIGIAFEIQKSDENFQEDHDIRLDLIITEKDTY